MGPAIWAKRQEEESDGKFHFTTQSKVGLAFFGVGCLWCIAFGFFWYRNKARKSKHFCIFRFPRAAPSIPPLLPSTIEPSPPNLQLDNSATRQIAQNDDASVPAHTIPEPYPAYPRPPRVRPRVRRPDSPRPSMIPMNNETPDEAYQVQHQTTETLSDRQLPTQDEPEQLPPYEPSPPPYSPYPWR
ncbi:hypothetical protein CNMCM6106_000697 [Aspergillus hiratsukae]|uniref:Uncharacterized protein n=1 Tax=Aspergillus hiratsukae TaxID=1194566 RepID=A0A8H6UUW3_9EURO|nr:hypothetical protein CNMCM6106_000697 [Aspergillus hiratsukae]